MLHKLKPVPRALVVLGIVGAIGFGLMKVDFTALMPAKKAVQDTAAIEAPAVTTVAPPAQVQQAQVQAPEPQAPAKPAGGLTPATNDAGLDAVLRARK